MSRPDESTRRRRPSAGRRRVELAPQLGHNPTRVPRDDASVIAELEQAPRCSTARGGGGPLPLLELPGPAVAIDPGPAGATALAADLRAGDPAAAGRIHDDRPLRDPRPPTDDEARAVRAVSP